MTELYQLIMIILSLRLEQLGEKNHKILSMSCMWFVFFPSAFKFRRVHVGHKVITSLLPGKWINRELTCFICGASSQSVSACWVTKHCVFASHVARWVSGVRKLIFHIHRANVENQSLEAVWALRIHQTVQSRRIYFIPVQLVHWTIWRQKKLNVHTTNLLVSLSCLPISFILMRISI